MPGPDVVRQLQTEPDTAKLPFILLTAASQGSDRAKGIAFGAYAYLVKPFSPLELLDAAERILAQQGGVTA